MTNPSHSTDYCRILVTEVSKDVHKTKAVNGDKWTFRHGIKKDLRSWNVGLPSRNEKSSFSAVIIEVLRSSSGVHKL